jgi:hypothetical protein
MGMKTTLVFVVTGATTSTLLLPAEGSQRALGFSIRSDEGATVRVEGYGTIDGLAGHLRFECNRGMPASPTWNTMLFHPASLGMPAAYAIEVGVDHSLLESLIADARVRTPIGVRIEVDGLEPDFSGTETVWVWDPVDTPSLTLHSLKFATALTV